MVKKGLQNLFIGALLSAIGAVIPVVGTIIAFVGWILLLVGLNQAGKEVPGFAKAFKIMIWAVVAAVIGAIIGMIITAGAALSTLGGSGSADDAIAAGVSAGAIASVIVLLVTAALEVWAYVLTIKTCQSITDPATAQFGQTTLTVYIIGLIFATVISSIAQFGLNWLTYVAGIGTITAQVLFAIFTKKVSGHYGEAQPAQPEAPQNPEEF